MSARDLSLYLTLVVLFSSTSGFAQAITVKGRVFAEGGLPLPTAKVVCFDGDTKLTLAPVTVKLNGSFTFSLAFDGTHLTCEYSAPNFVSTRLTLDVYQGVAEAGDVSLRKKKNLRVNPLNVAYSADGLYTFLDTFLLNDSATAIEVRQIEVKGTALDKTSCLDIRPTVTFTVTAALPMSRSEGIPIGVESPMDNWKDSIIAEGKLEELPCKQKRLFLEIAYPFILQPGENRKIRVAIPRELTTAAGQAARVDLREWRFLSAKFILLEGEPVESVAAH